MRTSEVSRKDDVDDVRLPVCIISDQEVLETPDDEVVEVVRKPPPDRATWGGKIEFIMTCIGFAVGLGNVWRFPYLCYKNGGGAFLIPYFLMLSVLGLPLFFMEFAFGQFASLGAIAIWSISPLFKGIGHAMVTVSWILVIYYQVVVSHAVFFFIASMTSVLPWTSCGNWWNTEACFDRTNQTLNATLLNKTTSPSGEYYYNYVLEMSEGIEYIGLPSWKLVLCLFGCWTISAIVVCKGVASLGKVSYVTAIFPYILLTILLIRSVLLPGAWEGIKFYLYPDFSRLLDPRVWVEAATQIFFSLSCCNGGLIAMSSFNEFKNNCCRDAVIVALINCATSLYAGFVIFANLGFMAHENNSTVDAVAQSGPGLAFVVYPEAMTKMVLPPLWSTLFFFMMCTLGFGSQFSILESVLSGCNDEMKRLGLKLTGRRQILFRCSMCLVNCLLGIPMICAGGYYLFYLIDNYLSGYPLLLIAIAETLVISYVYGMDQFYRDIELMIGTRPNIYWRICWKYLTPGISVVLVVFLFVAGEEIKLEGYTYPRWALMLGNLIAATPVVMIPIWFLYKYCREGGFILLRELLKPVIAWGPAHEENRAEFLTVIRSEESLKRMVTQTNGSQVQMSHGLGGSVISGLAGTIFVEDPKFFQSKLSVAEKLTQVHAKEVMKRVASGAEFGSTDAVSMLTASQTALANAAASSILLYTAGQINQPTNQTDQASNDPEPVGFHLPPDGDSAGGKERERSTKF